MTFTVEDIGKTPIIIAPGIIMFLPVLTVEDNDMVLCQIVGKPGTSMTAETYVAARIALLLNRYGLADSDDIEQGLTA